MLSVLSEGVARFLGADHRMLIGGELVEAREGATFPVHDPSTGSIIAEVPLAGAADVDDAVAAARGALPGWAAMAPAARAALMWRLGDRIEELAAELAEIDSLDNGKPVGEALAVDVPLTAGIFRYYAGWVTKVAGRVLPVSTGPFHTYTVREPVGVVGAIVPWNFPLLMCGYKLGPALAAGCTVVLKPAEQTPLSALRLAEIVTEVGFPPGVVNVLTGYGETTGAPLAAHPGVDKLTFTGETGTGRLIAHAAAERLARVTLELGGKSPNVVFADADIDAAVAGAHGAVFFNQGQCCIAGARLLVQEPVFDEVVTKLAARASEVRLGRGLDAGTEMGPLVSGEQRERVHGYVLGAAADGAQVVAGGAPAAPDAWPDGYFYPPTVIVEAAHTSRIMREEVFGPVVAALPFRDEDEAVALANDTAYGLAAGVWTGDVKRAHRVAHAVQAGTVWVNTYGMFDPAASYGGYKQSGYGRELGEESLEPYLQAKTVWVDLS